MKMSKPVNAQLWKVNRLLRICSFPPDPETYTLTYPLHCSSGPAGWCQFTAIFVPPLIWWVYVYRYVSCFPHHTRKKSQRQVALRSVQMETGNLSDSPHVSSWRRRKHPGFWLKGRGCPGLPRGKTVRSSLSVRLTQHIWLLGGLRFPLKESKALLGNQTS